MEDPRRAILSRVASGELHPRDAALMLDELEIGPAPEAARAAPADGSAAPATGARISGVRVVRSLGRLDVTGDPGVMEAVADGPHVARREGDLLVIEGSEREIGDNWVNFMFGDRNRRPDADEFKRPLRVRVNPDLPLEVEALAGSVRISGMRGPIRADVQAGQTRVDGFAGPIDLSAQAGTIRATGRLTGGASRIRCDAGSVYLELAPDSSVRMQAHATLGKVTVDGAPIEAGGWVVGTGEGSLDIDATMGSVRVRAGR